MIRYSKCFTVLLTITFLLMGCSSKSEPAKEVTKVDLQIGQTVEENNVEIEGNVYTYIKYSLENNKGIRIHDLKCTGDTLIIPSKVRDYPVKKVAENAFQFAGIKKLIINSQDVVLEENAFYMSSLTEVKFPAQFRGKIERGCFAKTDIRVFEWPAFEEGFEQNIAPGALEDCHNLTQIIFPENQNHIYIGKNMFQGLKKLKRLEFPASTKMVTYENCTYADDYPNSVEALIFKGKETKICGVEYRGEGDYNFITVGKIVAPKDSKAAAFAKKALKIGKLLKWFEENEESGDTIENYSEYWNDDGLEFVPVEYEES